MYGLLHGCMQGGCRQTRTQRGRILKYLTKTVNKSGNYLQNLYRLTVSLEACASNNQPSYQSLILICDYLTYLTMAQGKRRLELKNQLEHL